MFGRVVWNYEVPHGKVEALQGSSIAVTVTGRSISMYCKAPGFLSLTESHNELPRQIKGVDEIEYLVINDGSSDDTEQVALNWGVNYIVQFKRNLQFLFNIGKLRYLVNRPLADYNVCLPVQNRPNQLLDIFDYVKKSMLTILRAVLMYKPLKIFFLLGSTVMLGGIAIGTHASYTSVPSMTLLCILRFPFSSPPFSTGLPSGSSKPSSSFFTRYCMSSSSFKCGKVSYT